MEDRMKNRSSDIAIGAIISSCIVFPLMLLEYVNTEGFAGKGFPAALYIALWLMPFLLLVLMIPVVRHLRSGNGLDRNRVIFVLKTALAIGIVVIWVNILMDQAPCFMGVPNCD